MRIAIRDSFPRIVIIGDRERVVGPLVDAVIGMQRCAVDAISRLFHDERPDELFASAARLEPGAPPLALLEPARLAALAGTWCAAAGLGARPVAVEADLQRELRDDGPSP